MMDLRVCFWWARASGEEQGEHKPGVLRTRMGEEAVILTMSNNESVPRLLVAAGSRRFGWRVDSKGRLTYG